MLGIEGSLIFANQFSNVLPVIQQLSTAARMNTNTILDNSTPFYPSNEDYHELHNAHIDQNIDDINALGSKYAVPLLNNIINTQRMEYKDETSS